MYFKTDKNRKIKKENFLRKGKQQLQSLSATCLWDSESTCLWDSDSAPHLRWGPELRMLQVEDKKNDGVQL